MVYWFVYDCMVDVTTFASWGHEANMMFAAGIIPIINSKQNI